MSKAHKTRDSLIAVPFRRCFGLSPAFLSQFTTHVCLAAEGRKNTKTPYFGGSKSFKVIDVNTTKKFLTSACYDKQHVCADLQPFFTLHKPMAVIGYTNFLGGRSIKEASARGRQRSSTPASYKNTK